MGAAKALKVEASKAHMDIDSYEHELADTPFWRFSRRRDIGNALADARREERALRYLLKTH